MKNLMHKYMVKDYKSDDMGRGKSGTANSRHRRTIKKKAKREFETDSNRG